MNLWVDDIRTPPFDSYVWARSVNEAITAIKSYERNFAGSDTIFISLDHDAGDFVKDGGDYIRVLNWLEREKIVDTGYFFHLHTCYFINLINVFLRNLLNICGLVFASPSAIKCFTDI